MSIATSVSQDDVLVTRREAAEILRLKVATLANWASDGRHLPFIRVGSKCMYRRGDLEKWLKSRVVNPTAGDPS